jgi:hypothetical protein
MSYQCAMPGCPATHASKWQMCEAKPSKQISEERLRDTRAWAAARIGTLSGAEVIVGAIDELLQMREDWRTICEAADAMPAPETTDAPARALIERLKGFVEKTHDPVGFDRALRAVEQALAARSVKAGETPAPRAYQDRVFDWAADCFGQTDALDREMRAYRFLEEALELVQACGCTKEAATQVLEYVFGRPAGAIEQEVGGTMVSLAVLCQAFGVGMNRCGEAELTRVLGKTEEIRQRHASKPKFGSQLKATCDDWIACSDRLPPHGRKVIAYFRNELGNGRTVFARHIEKFKDRADNYDCDADVPEDFFDTDESGTSWVPEGWYEETETHEQCLKLHNAITHWRPLPAMPEQVKTSSPQEAS